MSHFVGIVIGEEVEKQLEPFWELDLSDLQKRNDKRAEFQVEIKKEDFEKKTKSILCEYKLRNKTDKKYEKEIKETEKLLKEKNFIKILQNYYFSGDCENGDFGHWFNPNAKWDWYLVGGRWTGFFKLKKGKKGKSEKLSKVEKLFMNKEQIKKREEFLKNRANSAIKKDIDFRGVSTPFCIIKDGKWIEKGEMNYYGMSSNNKEEKEWEKKYKKIIKSLPEDTLLTAVDFHI